MGYSDAYPGGYGSLSTQPATSLLLETDPDVFEDISDWLISGSVRRGRSEELDEFQAGTCELVLDNDDRTFDPNNEDGPFYGYILPMRRVQLTAAFDGESYPLFYGYADRWTQNREGPHRGTTTLAATDGFKLLARANLASSVYSQLVAEDAPAAWWRLDEQGGTVARDSAGDHDLDTVQGAPELGATTLVARDPGGALELGTGDGLYAAGALAVTAAPLSLELVLQKGAGSGTVFAALTQFAGALYGIAFDADDAVGFQVATPGGSANVASTVAWDDDTVHHIVAVWNADNSLKIWVDGVETTSGTPSLTAASFPGTGYHIIGASPFDGTAAGVYDEIALYDHALSSARIAAHAAAVTTPWDGDLPGARIERVLDAVSWPDDLRDVDTGTTTLQPATLDMSALEHVQKVAASELGQVYVKADGTLRFEERDNAVNQTPVAGFSDAAGSDLPITFSAAELSDAQIRNDVTVSRLDGIAQRVQDADSIADYQIASYTRDGLYHDDDDHSRYAAQYLLAAYKTPFERVSSMTVNPYADPASLWAAILAVELTDWVTLEETPQNTGDPVSRTVSVEGISHQFGPKAWEATFDLAPVSEQGVGLFWQLGTAGFSELGETTRLFL